MAGDGAALLDPGSHPDGFNFFLVSMKHGPTEHDNIGWFARNLKVTGVCHQECTAVTAQLAAAIAAEERLSLFRDPGR